MYTSIVGPQLESRGTSLEKDSYRNIRIHHAKQGCFGRLTVTSGGGGTTPWDGVGGGAELECRVLV